MARGKKPSESHTELARDERFSEQRMEIAGVLLIGVSLLSLLAISMEGAGFIGGIGEILRSALHFVFGERGAIFPVVIAAVIGWTLLTRRQHRRLARNLTALVLLFFWAITVMHLCSGVPLTGNQWDQAYRGGGVIGHLLAFSLNSWFGKFGSVVFLLIWLTVAVILSLNRPLVQVIAGWAARFSKPSVPPAGETIAAQRQEARASLNPESSAAVSEVAVAAGRESAPAENQRGQSSILNTLQGMLKEKEQKKEQKKQRETAAEPLRDERPAKEAVIPVRQPGNGKYVLPDPNLLGPASPPRKSTRSTEQSRQLEETLAHFGVQAQVIDVHCGPVITRYDLHPAPGVKVSRIVNLADDLALALAAKGLRLEAPIPGKAAIGIEVPNQETQIVTFRDTLESKAFWNSGKLSVALGLDIGGEVAIADLRKMPHLLVAGSTGSGKSVCINTLIMSVLFKAFPNEVKLIMIDPKMVELSMYNGIPHLMAPVVTEAKKAAGVLKLVVDEMEKRYKTFAEARVREIDKYNEMVPEEERLPYILVVIDELADLMMIAPAEVEDAICRLAQMARATGIHLVIATQRPSVDVITGLIKANVPSRIAFAVKSQIDSRTILDTVGAERLLGRGDMLFAPVGAMKPNRIQGALVVEKEIELIIKHWKEQGEPNYQEQYVNVPESQDEVMKDEEDDLFWEAVRVVIEHGQASASVLQRKLRVGYTRAARLVDMMEAKGMIGPYEGSKPREVMITGRQLEELRKRASGP
jgi:S-DNA-T family DNA segregation ATPase FtsK/SpoIIIE